MQDKHPLLNFQTEGAALSVDVPPTVIHPHAIIIKKHGRVLGTVAATYDFSDLPESYHWLAWTIVQQSRVVHDATGPLNREEKSILDAQEKPRSMPRWLAWCLGKAG